MSKHLIILSILPFMLGINVNAGTSLHDIDKRVDNLETEVNNIQTSIATLTKNQKQQSTQLNNIEKTQQQQSLQLENMQKEQMNLQNAVNSMPGQTFDDMNNGTKFVPADDGALGTNNFTVHFNDLQTPEEKQAYVEQCGLQNVHGIEKYINNNKPLDDNILQQIQPVIAKQLSDENPYAKDISIKNYGLFTPGNTPEDPYPTQDGTNPNINQDIGPGLPINQGQEGAYIAGVTPDPNQVLENMFNKPESTAEQTRGYSDSSQIYASQSDGSEYIDNGNVYINQNNNTPVSSPEQMNNKILNGLDNINDEKSLFDAAKQSQELNNIINKYKEQNNIDQLFPDDIYNIKQEFANRVINNQNYNDEYPDMTHSQLNLSTSANPDYDRDIRAQILNDKPELANQMTQDEQQHFIDTGMVPEGKQQLKQELDNLQNTYNEQANIDTEYNSIIEELQNTPAEQRQAILAQSQNDGTLQQMTQQEIDQYINTGKLPNNDSFYEQLQNNIAQQYNMDNNLQYNAPGLDGNIIPGTRSDNIQDLKYKLTPKNLSKSMNDPNSNQLSSLDISNSIRTNIDQNSSHEELFQKLLATQKALEESNSKLQACEYNCKLLKNQSKGQNTTQVNPNIPNINNLSSNIEPNIGIPNTNIQSGNIVVQESNINQVPFSEELTIEQNNTQNIDAENDEENDEFSTLVNTIDNTTPAENTPTNQGQPIISKQKNVIPISNPIFTQEVKNDIEGNIGENYINGEEQGNENEEELEYGDNSFGNENIEKNAIVNQQMINQQQVLSGQIETSALQNQPIDNNGNIIPSSVNNPELQVNINENEPINPNIPQENPGQEQIIQDPNIAVKQINPNEPIYAQDQNIIQQQVPNISNPNEQNSMQLIPSANQKIVKGQNNLNNKDMAQEQFITEEEPHETQQEIIEPNEENYMINNNKMPEASNDFEEYVNSDTNDAFYALYKQYNPDVNQFEHYENQYKYNNNQTENMGLKNNYQKLANETQYISKTEQEQYEEQNLNNIPQEQENNEFQEPEIQNIEHVDGKDNININVNWNQYENDIPSEGNENAWDNNNQLIEYDMPEGTNEGDIDEFNGDGDENKGNEQMGEYQAGLEINDYDNTLNKQELEDPGEGDGNDYEENEQSMLDFNSPQNLNKNSVKNINPNNEMNNFDMLSSNEMGDNPNDLNNKAALFNLAFAPAIETEPDDNNQIVDNNNNDFLNMDQPEFGNGTDFQFGDQNQNIAGYDINTNYNSNEDLDYLMNANAINNAETIQNPEGNDNLFDINDFMDPNWNNDKTSNNNLNMLQNINTASKSNSNVNKRLNFLNDGMNQGFNILQNTIHNGINKLGNTSAKINDAQKFTNSSLNKFLNKVKK